MSNEYENNKVILLFDININHIFIYYIFIYIQSTLGKSDYGLVGIPDKSDTFSWFGWICI